MTPEIAARLESCAIQLAAQTLEYSMFVRGACTALVRAESGEFTSLGSSGLMTEDGLAYLFWQAGKAMLLSHGRQTEASDEQARSIQEFSQDLKKAIWP